MITVGVADVVSLDDLVDARSIEMKPESQRARAKRNVSTNPVRMGVATTVFLASLVLPQQAEAVRAAARQPEAPSRAARGSGATSPEVRAPSDIRREFDHLADRWESETSLLPSLADAFEHPAYKRIIAMGPDVVPLLLERMKTAPDHWDYALSQITGENPVPEAAWGDLGRTATAWLEWGQQHLQT